MTTKMHIMLVFAIGAFFVCAHASGQSAQLDDATSPNASEAETTEQTEDSAGGADGTQATPIRVIADPELARVEENAEEADEEELICRREQVTGTHRRVRRCFTRAELDAQREDAQQFLRDRVIRTAPEDGSQ